MPDAYVVDMRTTIRLDDDLLREAKAYALATDRTLTRLIEDALRAVLGQREVLTTRRRLRLRTFKGSGLRSGVNLDNNAALLDLMEGTE
jgi:predicted transcriptional regulator